MTLSFMTDYWTIFGILAVAGFGWAMINVNSIVMVWQHLGESRLGAGTGLYYFASMGAAITGPVVTGVLFDLTSIAYLFPISLIFFIGSFVLMLTVKTGEVGDAAVSD